MIRLFVNALSKKFFFQKKVEKGVLKTYKKYVNATNDKEAIERFKKHDRWYDAKTDEEKEEIEKEFDKI